MDIPEKEERLEWIYTTKGFRELEQRYDAWAQEYDEDLRSYGYRFPAVFTGLVARHAPRVEDPILDAGAGTGILGESLHILGYRDLVAIDLSRGMLKAARRKGIYRELRQMELGKPLDFPNDCFAASVAMGVLTVGHGPPQSLNELVRITRPGGLVIFSMINDEIVQPEFRARQELIERDGCWSLVEQVGPFQTLPYGEPEITHKVFVYRVS